MTDTHTNGIDSAIARKYVGAIQAKFGEMLSERGAYMATCKAIRQDIKDLKVAANDEGLATRPLNLLLKEMDLEAKLTRLKNAAEQDVVDMADMIREALGEFADSPLGNAAVTRVEARSAQAAKDDAAPKRGRGRPKGSGKKIGNGADADKGAALDGLMDRDAAAAQDNAAKLEAGIHPLDN